ncbi:nucleoside-diphosphate sugar epimerase [Marinobacterium nitratireducens]|uniref:Nucleoside-diphosphate sugar epimerase n=1 Tax=Marinobacterium nitratireducens TaxID=518897 RepID=A0A917Z8E3_9GAMM|nr:mitochondrial fission ELM1 family protein [Marinobacterium nitratireducens]GGO77993.1 nucleoside-diphosphate sugar epimerase [Marinobacterium nitratireducens]
MTDICIISDGKPGHLNQSRGLAEALQRQRPGVEVIEIPPLGRGAALGTWLSGRAPSGLAVPDGAKPSLLIGAGHATHATLLALKRAWRLPAVVLMKPSLPLRCFDLCLIPEHDRPPVRDNVVRTRGALNRMRPGRKQPGQGVILIGGPSRHSGWDEASLFAQLDKVLGDTGMRWRMTSSRRTPEATERRLAGLPNVDFVPAGETGPDWLPTQLTTAETCWVTGDSVSMVYEALSAGCAVGILSVPQNRENRLQQGVRQLAQRGLVLPFDSWRGGALPLPASQFDEAGRCAELLLARGWLD